MTNEEAKFILQAYRPNGADATDATFHPSLAQAKKNTELGMWLGQQQAFDRAVAAKLQAVVPPPDLLSTILTGAGVEPRQIRVWWRQPRWLAMAASILVVFTVGLAGLMGTRANANDSLPVFATDYVTGGFFLNQHSANLDELRSWLTQQNAPWPKEIPARFAQLRSLGCRTLDYRGKEVSLICFGAGREYHLFVARRDDFPLMPTSAVPQFFVRKGHTTAAWSDDANFYVVVTDDSLKALKECIGCNST